MACTGPAKIIHRGPNQFSADLAYWLTALYRSYCKLSLVPYSFFTVYHQKISEFSPEVYRLNIHNFKFHGCCGSESKTSVTFSVTYEYKTTIKNRFVKIFLSSMRTENHIPHTGRRWIFRSVKLVAKNCTDIWVLFQKLEAH